jgi:hypothetical protein
MSGKKAVEKRTMGRRDGGVFMQAGVGIVERPLQVEVEKPFLL